MRTTQQLSITLPIEMAQKVKARVASGDYASESEVIREGLRALDERDAVVERWLREEVVPTYEAYKADPTNTLSLEEVFERLDARISVKSNAPG
jgi:putative addiction module CopG family antidote